MAVNSQIVTVGRDGEISIPTAVLARWRTERVVVIDMGDHVVVAPTVDDPISFYRGWGARSDACSTDEMRRQDREDDAEREVRRLGFDPSAPTGPPRPRRG